MQRAHLGSVLLAIAVSVVPAQGAPGRGLRFRALRTHPHDPTAFTQGLELRGEELFESTGLYGESTLRAVDLRTGRVRTRAFLPPNVFGEGMTIFHD